MSPSLIIGWVKIEQELISVAIAEEIRMITEGLFCRSISAETFILLVIVIEHLGSRPVMTLDSEVIVGLHCKLGQSVS